MDEVTFRNAVLSEFPGLREDLDEWEGLIHLQVSEFRRFTQNAIEGQSFEVVSKCFRIATEALLEGDASLRNAIYVSYLEHLDFHSDAGKRAKQLMPHETMTSDCSGKSRGQTTDDAVIPIGSPPVRKESKTPGSRFNPDTFPEYSVCAYPPIDQATIVPDLEPGTADRFDNVQVFVASDLTQHNVSHTESRAINRHHCAELTRLDFSLH